MSTKRQSEYPVHPLFLERWSPRAFTGERLPTETLMTMLEAARWAPSAYNIQPWRFVYALRDTESWSPIFDTLVDFNQSWVSGASALVVLLSAEQSTSSSGQTKPNPWHSFDTGSAWMSLALQAQLSGWAAHGMAGFDAQRLREALAVPPGYAIKAVAAIGKPAHKGVLPESLQEMEAPRGRVALGQLVFEGRFAGGR
jgi:nitroreductase